jgi:hypothetical protein
VTIDQNLETHLRHCFTLKESSCAQAGYAASGISAIIEGPDDISFTTKFGFFEFWRGSGWNRAKKGRAEASPALFTDSQDG